ncbi:predicted protein [Nematostella vectensis]|uniref:Uncharacterized protein n=2 Tax=Nematostella vectensis TaxID=45351 RepID=A7RTM2_NEMVE|nr:predicted protein [Nematostella vectensis]|eukprot:XP_001637354.1 predicted protein [Nematostella vectensis]
MNWIVTLTILSSVCFFKVLCEDSAESLPKHEPLVAMWCGKVNQHMDINTGEWATDENGHSMCSTSTKQVLKYCQHVYPKLNVSNVVEANMNVTIKTWCDPKNVNCNATKTVLPYRCLVGKFEADALLVPPGCRFQHLHPGSECKSHDFWKIKAEEKCKDQDANLRYYGVLLPCNTGLFTGVEFVCCPVKKPDNKLPFEKVVPAIEVEVATPIPTTAPPASIIDKLEAEVKEYDKKIIPALFGCNLTKYREERKKLNEQHRVNMKQVIKQWEDAEKRYNILHKDEPKQAEQMMAGVMARFKETISTLEQQAKLERQRLHEEHHQCLQIHINEKRHKTIKTFLRELRREIKNPDKILAAMRMFTNICNEDRVHNLRYFKIASKHNPEMTEEMRANLKEHLDKINQRMNDTMTLLYNMPKIMRKFAFELPNWAPKIPLPTEPPTEKMTEAPTTPSAVHGEEDKNKPHRKHEERERHHGRHGNSKKHRKHDEEDEPENERDFFGEPRSPATFAAVIGLSCGALVIMIVIIVAMAMRRSRGSSATKTVLVDPDADGNSEKQRLTDLQENGYENPTYKFYDY